MNNFSITDPDSANSSDSEAQVMPRNNNSVPILLDSSDADSNNGKDKKYSYVAPSRKIQKPRFQFFPMCMNVMTFIIALAALMVGIYAITENSRRNDLLSARLDVMEKNYEEISDLVFIYILTVVEGEVESLRAPQNFKLPSKFRHHMG